MIRRVLYLVAAPFAAAVFGVIGGALIGGAFITLAAWPHKRKKESTE
jgi:hypothetical protein